MANTNLTTDLSAMHDAIVADIKAKFPAFATVEFYREDRKDIPRPACILELEEMPPADGEDPGNGQVAIEARFVAHLVIGFLTPEARLEIRLAAAAFAAFIRLRRWTGITCGQAVFDGAREDDFMPELDQFECWRVDWSQVIYIGEDAWSEAGATRPTQILYSNAPDIGEGNADKYKQINS